MRIERGAQDGNQATTTRPTHPRERATKVATLPPAAEDLMNMDQAIAMLKTARSTFYRW